MLQCCNRCCFSSGALPVVFFFVSPFLLVISNGVRQADITELLLRCGGGENSCGYLVIMVIYFSCGALPVVLVFLGLF